ncbi:MAG: hypothetical protein ACJAYE_003743, partial [Candidatus Azotimanducaceae bacterium]
SDQLLTKQLLYQLSYSGVALIIREDLPRLEAENRIAMLQFFAVLHQFPVIDHSH